MAINFNTSNDTLRKLLGNSLTYEIPSFQRDYSWGKEEWEELWEDIQALMPEGGESEHYMGYLVLQTSDNKQHSIIDGQQRLTTASIMILAAISHLEEIAENGDAQVAKENRLRARQLRDSYIGYLDTETLVSKSKLKLNRHNDKFYQTYIVPLEKRIPQRRIIASERSIRNALEWFKKKINEHSGNKGQEVARLINIFVDKLFFTVITVTDELNAFKVFETLNSRGVRLSTTDLLKNYLFSIASSSSTHPHELEQMERIWEGITGLLGQEDFPKFLRVFWNSRYRFARKSELFKTIRDNVQTRKYAFTLLREMDYSSGIYAALKNPTESVWERRERRALEELKMFSVRQPLPLLLSCFEKFSELDRTVFTGVLEAISIISFRYNVICRLPAGDQERVYVRVAREISDGKLTDFQSILAGLKDIYPNDKTFETAFGERELITANSSRNKKIIRYILFALEKNISGYNHDFEDDSITIEHICPTSPENNSWSEETEQYVYRIGNMTLLEARSNRDIGHKPYEEKNKVYSESKYQITQSIPQRYKEWNESKIRARQTALARRTKSIWTIQ